jgi:ubiquinone/menaquinone biosynthesis C-methylase UbiE
MGNVAFTEEEEATGNLYDQLFYAYTDEQFEDSISLFYKRHRMWSNDQESRLCKFIGAHSTNSVPSLDWFKDRICLDAGCGQGRYVVALARLGTKKVVGVDINSVVLNASTQRRQFQGLRNAELRRASVLDLPFPDSYFDYVVCSGVIHHTPAPHKAFNELVRVLKAGGKLWLNVYGKGGLVWLMYDVGRIASRKISFEKMNELWACIGIPANKRYNYLDNLYVPYCHRFTEDEIAHWLAESGFEHIVRLKFERYDYEAFSSRILYGEGWLQFYADKL